MLPVLFLVACVAPDDPREPIPDSIDTAPADTADPLPCPTFGGPIGVGTVVPVALDEASGVEVVDGVLWTHNDSANAPVLFGLRPDGSQRAAIHLSDVTGVDIEDIARLDGQLILADVGDNLGIREQIGLWTLPIPTDLDAAELTGARPVVLTWDAGPRNAETLLADPITGDLLVVSKEPHGNSHVGRIATPLPDVGVLETVAVLPFATSVLPGDELATGGAIAPDGSAVVIRTYDEAFVWPRVPGEPWPDTFERPACRIALAIEAKGEAIAWSPDGLYTLSEGVNPTVWFYPAREP